jgi:hypothetical protein
VIATPNSGVISFGGLKGSSDLTESGFKIGLFEDSEVVENLITQKIEMK